MFVYEGYKATFKLFVSTKSAPVDETKYRVLQDGYYTISYGSSYMTVNDKADVEMSSAPQKFYFQYRPGGYYTVTSEQGYILTANSSNDADFMFFSGKGVTLDEDWLEDESISYNVICKMTPTQ